MDLKKQQEKRSQPESVLGTSEAEGLVCLDDSCLYKSLSHVLKDG